MEKKTETKEKIPDKPEIKNKEKIAPKLVSEYIAHNHD